MGRTPSAGPIRVNLIVFRQNVKTASSLSERCGPHIYTSGDKAPPFTHITRPFALYHCTMLCKRNQAFSFGDHVRSINRRWRKERSPSPRALPSGEALSAGAQARNARPYTGLKYLRIKRIALRLGLGNERIRPHGLARLRLKQQRKHRAALGPVARLHAAAHPLHRGPDDV